MDEGQSKAIDCALDAAHKEAQQQAINDVQSALKAAQVFDYVPKKRRDDVQWLNRNLPTVVDAARLDVAQRAVNAWREQSQGMIDAVREEIKQYLMTETRFMVEKAKRKINKL